ncbi:MAG: ABC transporter permease subunit, partial [Planctomycetales bacterium]|nr:ABC transporter permease subunit [Planctomycetales bacterium]
ALIGALLWGALESAGGIRLAMTFIFLPVVFGAICIVLFASTAARLLHPPDVGSEGKEVVDIDEENKQAIGLVIQRDQFPDKLFAPPKRNDFLADGANPVYDKEIRSEIFSQGTLMMRVVIQVSMFLAIPLMAVCLYMVPWLAPWYISYVIVFNMLVGPVFSAGTVTSERERQTLDLLLCTTVTPLQILWGKLIAGLRISTVLTSFLLWPVLLAAVMVTSYWSNLLTIGAYLSIVGMACLTTATLALFCSTCFRKTSASMMTTYAVILALYCVPLAATFFADTFFAGTPEADMAHALSAVSPIAAAMSAPLDLDMADATMNRAGDWRLYGGYMAFTSLLVCGLLGAMVWMFNTRWRVSE